MADYLIPVPSVEKAGGSQYKGTFIYNDSNWKRDYYVLREDADRPWWAIGMIAKVGSYDHPVIVSDRHQNVYTICDKGGGASASSYEISYKGKTYYCSGYTPYATNTNNGKYLQNNIIPYSTESFTGQTESDFKNAGLKLLELYEASGGSFPKTDYLISEPTENVEGNIVTKIYQGGENSWWCASKSSTQSAKWWEIGAIVKTMDGKNTPVIISNTSEYCHVANLSYNESYKRYLFSLSSEIYSFTQDEKELYCCTSETVYINDEALFAAVPILDDQFYMEENGIVQAAKMIVNKYLLAGGVIPDPENTDPAEEYQKVDYTPIGWQDDGPPDIDAENLGKMDDAIDRLCRNLDIVAKMRSNMVETSGKITE